MSISKSASVEEENIAPASVKMNDLPPDCSLAPAISFCSICEKPFTSANSRDRHFRYCGRHTRKRLRSCQACNAAKTKCSFEVPCSRCTKKDVKCLYDEPLKARFRPLSRSTAAAPEIETGQITSLDLGAASTDNEVLTDLNFNFSEDLDTNDNQNQFISGNKLQPSEPTFEELLAFDDGSLPQDYFLADMSLFLQSSVEQQSESWCAWMRGNVSLAVVTDAPFCMSNGNYPAALHSKRPHAQHNADLIIQSLRSFPTMMLRRETFPWFIHPQSQLLLGSIEFNLPAALSNCMSIAQMFASRTLETRHFLRQSIRAEYHRFASEMYQMSKFDLLAAMQACMMYLIMFIIDYAPEDEGNARELLLALLDLYLLFKRLDGGCVNEVKITRVTPSWEDWIFAESQRRFANLWLLVGYAICVKNGNILDESRSYRNLPLPSPKSLWEASTQSSWELEYEACYMYQSSGLTTLGDLIDAQHTNHIPSNAQKLDKWNAGVDNLGCLLNLIGSME